MSVGGLDTWTFGSFPCAGIQISSQTNAPFDLFVKINANNDPSAGFFAAAMICGTSNLDDRPVAGLYYLNFASMTKN